MTVMHSDKRYNEVCHIQIESKPPYQEIHLMLKNTVARDRCHSDQVCSKNPSNSSKYSVFICKKKPFFRFSPKKIQYFKKAITIT